MGPRYRDVMSNLRTAYDGGAAERDSHGKQPWKLAERAAFLRELQARQCRQLLEVGAGTGQDSAYFQEQGLEVVATDLSAEMVARCRDKGVDARVMDFLSLDFPPASFDAVYALNCLLHVPSVELPAVLTAIREVIRPGGLCYIGVYGGDGTESIASDDSHHPPRFFAFRTDEQMRQFAAEFFDVLQFNTVETSRGHFQSLTLQRPY